MFVRIPGWSKENSVKVNGRRSRRHAPGEYLPISGRWTSGDKVLLSFDMRPQVVHANPAVADDRGRIALQRGPVVYCMEQLDQLEASRDSSIFPRYTAHLTESTTDRYDPELARWGRCSGASWRPASRCCARALPGGASRRPAAGTDTKLKMIPYYAWSNRDLSAMQVWIPYQQG